MGYPIYEDLNLDYEIIEIELIYANKQSGAENPLTRLIS